MADENFSFSEVDNVYNSFLNPHLKNTLCWYISGKCNLNCSFCEAKKSDHDSSKELEYLTKNWINFREGFQNLQGRWEIFLLGGEPLSVPGILDILRDLVRNGHKISLATNLSYSLGYYKKVLNILDGNLCLFLGTFKPEYYKPEPFLKKAQHIDYLVKRYGGVFGVGAVAEPDYLDYLYTLGFWFRERNIKFKLQKKRVNNVHINYNKDQVCKIKEFGRRFSSIEDQKKLDLKKRTSLKEGFV